MPGLDRSGPRGAGSMTGGRRGLCGRSGNSAGLHGQDYFGGDGRLNIGRGPGRRFGMNRGSGRGFGRRAYSATSGYPREDPIDTPMSSLEEIKMLKAQADSIRKSMEVISNRIEALEKENSES